MIPEEHRRYLTKRFRMRCFRYANPGFAFAQRVALHRYGEWMLALETGAITPTNANQEHFVRVCRGELEPTTPLEKTWVSYKRHCEYEDAEERGRSQLDYEMLSERSQLLNTLGNCVSDNDCGIELKRLKEIDEDAKEIESVRGNYLPVCGGLDNEIESSAISNKRLLEMLADQFDESRLARLAKLRVGATVRHPKLGIGKIVKADPGKGALLLCVDFTQANNKWLMAEYADLEVVSE